MPPGLLTLLHLQFKGLLRRTLLSLRTLRGIIFSSIGLLLFVFWALPSVLSLRHGRTDPALVRTFTPIILLVVCVISLITSGGDKAVAFTPAEVGFLFPGPFTRRQLLGYKLIKSFVGAAASGAFLSLLFLRHCASWPAAFVGLLLSMMFAQLFAMTVMLVGQGVGERLYTRGRKLIVGAIIAAVGVTAWPHLKHGMPENPTDLAAQLRNSPAGRILLLPLEPFGRTMTAPTAVQILQWSSLAAVVDLVLLLVVMWLDVNYLEAAVTGSQKLYDRIQRARRGGVAAIAAPKAGRLRLPAFPWLAGAGPTGWRQLTSALRSSRGMLFLLFILAISVGPLLVAARNQAQAAGLVLGLAAWTTVIMAGTMRFDFRGDLDQMDLLKSLPLPPAAVAAGELFAPVLIMTFAHEALIVAAAFRLRSHREILLAGAALSPLFNLLLFALENLLFLYFPTRIGPASPGDFQNFGRQIVMFLLKFILMALAGGVAAAAAMLTWFLTRSLPLTIAAAAAVLLIESLCLIPLMAIAYDRFDPSTDTPT